MEEPIRPLGALTWQEMMAAHPTETVRVWIHKRGEPKGSYGWTHFKTGGRSFTLSAPNSPEPDSKTWNIGGAYHSAKAWDIDWFFDNYWHYYAYCLKCGTYPHAHRKQM